MPRWFPLLVVLIALISVSPAATANEADAAIAVPAVRGKKNAEAISMLESKGLKARVIQVAGPVVGRVSSQDPAAGTTVSKGALVTIRVGTKARVKTKMPDVMGQRAEDALETLTVAYDVHIQRTPGPADQAGRVLRTEPAPGTEIWLRGRVMVFVVNATGNSAVPPDPNVVTPTTAPTETSPAEPVVTPPAPTVRPPVVAEAAEDSDEDDAESEEDDDPSFKAPPLGSDVTLPDLVGQQLKQAKKTLKRLGLIVNVVRIFEAGAKKDEVVMQVPGGPAEVFAGDVVWLSVAKVTAVAAGTPNTGSDDKSPTAADPNSGTTTPTGKIETPTLVGLDVLAASQEIVRRGLLPHPWYVSRPGMDAWKVIAQKDPPGTPQSRYGIVHFRVVLPNDRAGKIHMPYLYGLTGQQATAVMRGLGLPTQARVVDAAGRVTLQMPQAGSQIAWGSPVTLTVGKVTDVKAAEQLPLVVMVPPGQTPPVPDPKEKKKNVIDKVGDFFGDLFD